MKKLLLIIIALVSVIAGCKIDEAGIPTQTSNSLLVGTWFIKSTTSVDPVYGASTVTSYTALDYYKFNSDFTINESSSQPDTVINSHYSYTNDVSGQKIVIGGAYSGSFTTYTVNKLTTDSLIMATTIVITSYGTTTTTSYIPLTYKFAHQ